MGYTCSKVGCQRIFKQPLNTCNSCGSKTLSPFYDFFKILEINPNHTTQELESAYKKASLKYHPDVNQNAKEFFIVISEARRILKNPVDKANYLNTFHDMKNGNFSTSSNHQPQAEDWQENLHNIFKHFRRTSASKKNQAFTTSAKRASIITSYLGAILGFFLTIVLKPSFVLPAVLIGFFGGKMLPHMGLPLVRITNFIILAGTFIASVVFFSTGQLLGIVFIFLITFGLLSKTKSWEKELKNIS